MSQVALPNTVKEPLATNGESPVPPRCPARACGWRELQRAARAQSSAGFGNGPHHCVGAHLSRRTVGVILLPMLFERFPNMTLPDPASVRWHGFGFRGPLNLPLLLQ